MSKVTTMSVDSCTATSERTLECVVEVVMYPPRSTMDGREGDESSDSKEARLSKWMCWLNAELLEVLEHSSYYLERGSPKSVPAFLDGGDDVS
jgi:hypothetical protein